MGYLYTILARFFASIMQCAAGQLSLSMAGIFLLSLPVCYSFAAYSLGISYKKFGLSMPNAMLIAIVLTTLLGCVFSYLYTKVSKDSFTILSLGSILAFEAFVKSFDELTGGVLGISGIIRPSFIKTLPKLIIFSLVIMLIIVLVQYLIIQSPMGRKIRALKEHPVALESLGVSTKSTAYFIIISGSILSGIAGILEILRIQFLDPSFGGIPNLIILVSIAILCVKAQVRNLILATAFVIFLPELISFLKFPSALLGHMRVLMYTAILIILLRNISGKFNVQNREA